MLRYVRWTRYVRRVKKVRTPIPSLNHWECGVLNNTVESLIIVDVAISVRNWLPINSSAIAKSV